MDAFDQYANEGKKVLKELKNIFKIDQLHSKVDLMVEKLKKGSQEIKKLDLTDDIMEIFEKTIQMIQKKEKSGKILRAGS